MLGGEQRPRGVVAIRDPPLDLGDHLSVLRRRIVKAHNMSVRLGLLTYQVTIQTTTGLVT